MDREKGAGAFSSPYDPLRTQFGCKTEVVTLLAFPNCDLHSKNSGNWLKLIGGTRSSHLPLDRKSLLNIISFKSSILLAVEIPTLLGIGYIFFMRSNQTSLSLFHIVVLVDLIHILLSFKLSDICSFRYTIFIYFFYISFSVWLVVVYRYHRILAARMTEEKTERQLRGLESNWRLTAHDAVAYWGRGWSGMHTNTHTHTDRGWHNHSWNGKPNP